MLTLKSLEFQNIGLFTEEPQVIDFTKLSNLNQLEGKNNNTGGSSGAAKSTVLRVLPWLLGLDGLPTTELQSRSTKDNIWAIGVFDLDGQVLKIERNKKLSIDIDGHITTGSSKITDEKLDEILGMPRSLFSKILHKKQGEGGFFLNMKGADTFKFLTSCLGLEKEQAKILTLDTKLKDLEKQEIALKSAYDSHQSALQATQNAISSIGHPPVLDTGPNSIIDLYRQHVVAKESHDFLKTLHRQELTDLEIARPVYTSIPFDRSAILFTEGEIRKIQEKISELNRSEEERQLALKSKISDLRIEASKLENAELTRQSEVRAKIQELQISISNIKNSEQSRISDVKHKILSNRGEYARLMSSVDTGNKAKEQASALMKELQKVRASMCPTCEQSWITDAAKIKEGTILTELGFLKKQVVTGMESQEVLKTIDLDHERLLLDSIPINSPKIDHLNIQIEQLKSQELSVLNPELTGLNVHISHLRVESQPQVVPEVLEYKLEIDFKTSILNNLRKDEADHQFKISAEQQLMVVNHTEKQTKLRESHEVAINSARTKENQALQDLQAAQNKVRSFEEAKLRFDESHGKLSMQLILHRDKSDLTHKELLAIQEEIELATEAKKVIKSYLSCSFEDALDGIGDAATKRIRIIPNTATATIEFEGLKENADGKVKEEINAMISMNGEIGIPIRTLCGGERSSADLSVDLSVIQFIEERTGKGIDVMQLDECFLGQDTVCIQEAIEMIRSYATEKKVILIDHNPIIAQTIESKITVIRDGQTSKVVQQ
jgi:hypothetical protein